MASSKWHRKFDPTRGVAQTMKNAGLLSVQPSYAEAV